MTEPSARIEERIEALLGTSKLPVDAGVLHVTALTRRGDRYATIAIDEHSPHSEHDLFALAIGRARADAIVISGKLLRDEPAYTIAAPRAELAHWRRAVLGRDQDPALCILTRSGDLDREHIIWQSATRPFVLTTPEGAARVRERLPGVECVAQPDTRLASALARLRSRGARTIVLEAGPNTTRQAYEANLVDELMLSTYYGPFPEGMNETAAPFELPLLESRLPEGGPVQTVEEPSGRWTFERRWR